MVEITPTNALIGAGIGLAGAEAVGVTNFSGSANDKEDNSEGQDTNSVINSLLAGVQIGEATGRGGGAGVDEGDIPQAPDLDLDLQSDGEGLTPQAGDGGLLGRGGLLTSGDSTDGLLPGSDADNTTDDNRTPGDASDRDSPYGGDPLGWNSDRVTEVAEDESQTFISGVFETGGNVLEGAVAGAGAGAVGGSVIPGAGTLAGAGIGAVGGGLTGLVGDPSDMAVDTGESAIDGATDIVSGESSGSSGGSDEPRDISTSSSADASYIEDDTSTNSVDTDGDGSPDASMVRDPESDIDTSSDSGSSSSRSLPTGSVDTDGDGQADASMVTGDEPDVSGGSSGGSSSIPGAVDTDGDGQADASMPTDEVDVGGETGSSDKSSDQDSGSSGGGFFSDPVGSIGDTVDDAGDTIGGFF